MTSPVSAIEAIEKAMEGVTPGPWYVAESGFGNKMKVPTVYHAGDDLNYVASFADFMTFHGPTRNLENARYIAACSPDRMRKVLALARQAEALERRAEEAEALAERLKLEARGHAQEARTANSTIYEIYQVVSGGNGEPGNWHGAKPVRAKLEALQRENAELREALRPFAECAPEWEGEPDSLHVFLEWNDEKDPVPSLPVADFRRARALLGGENAGN